LTTAASHRVLLSERGQLAPRPFRQVTQSTYHMSRRVTDIVAGTSEPGTGVGQKNNDNVFQGFGSLRRNQYRRS